YNVWAEATSRSNMWDHGQRKHSRQRRGTLPHEPDDLGVPRGICERRLLRPGAIGWARPRVVCHSIMIAWPPHRGCGRPTTLRDKTDFAEAGAPAIGNSRACGAPMRFLIQVPVMAQPDWKAKGSRGSCSPAA